MWFQSLDMHARYQVWIRGFKVWICICYCKVLPQALGLRLIILGRGRTVLNLGALNPWVFARVGIQARAKALAWKLFVGVNVFGINS